MPLAMYIYNYKYVTDISKGHHIK